MTLPLVKVKRRRGNVHTNLTLIIFRDVTLLQCSDFLTRFVDSFVNFDWLDLVIYIHTNELVNKTLLWSTFQTTAIYDEVLREVCATFGIETFQEEQQKARYVFRR